MIINLRIENEYYGCVKILFRHRQSYRNSRSALKTNLLIIFLELLKHCVELLLLLGRNKLGASPQRIADQSELR